MKIFVILFAFIAIIMFFGLAVKRGAQNRSEISEIEKDELKQALDNPEGKASSAYREALLGRIGSRAGAGGALAKTMKWFGTAVLFAGTIISFCSANTPQTDAFDSVTYGFSFLLFFTYELAACCAGFLFIAIGEIIRLLDDISKGLRSLNK